MRTVKKRIGLDMSMDMDEQDEQNAVEILDEIKSSVDVTREKIIMELAKVAFCKMGRGNRAATKVNALRNLAVMQGFVEPDSCEKELIKKKNDFNNLTPEQQKELFNQKLKALEDDAI